MNDSEHPHRPLAPREHPLAPRDLPPLMPRELPPLPEDENAHRANSSWNSRSLGEDDDIDDFDVIGKLMQKGLMVRVLRQAPTEDEFVVDHIYRGIRAELVRTKGEILRQSHSLLLDFYEKVLGLTDRYPMTNSRAKS